MGIILCQNNSRIDCARQNIKVGNRRAQIDSATCTPCACLACEDAIRYVEQRYGTLIGLVNNAGVNDGTGLEHGTPERFAQSLHQNLVHYYAMMHCALPMLKASRGSVVNISSKVALTGQGDASPYAAAKGARLSFDSGGQLNRTFRCSR